MENRKPIEVTFTDEVTLAKDVATKSLGYLFSDQVKFKYGHRWYSFDGSYQRFRQIRDYGKQYGISDISNEGITRVSFFWTDLPEDVALLPSDICLIKPFLVYPVPPEQKIILREYQFMPMDPELYKKVIANPNLLVL